ncbi:MAG: hypothetical protein JXM75_03525 [Chromatiaceae bacterium]|nr:hypothetical protein [Chromatiaceae bacterium]
MFSEKFYLANNEDVAIAVRKGLIGSGWQHWNDFGSSEGRLAFAPPAGYGEFNEEYYLANNPDVARAVQLGEVGTGWSHWVANGQFEEDRAGTPYNPPAGYADFNEEFYLANNPDVAMAVRRGDYGSGWDHWTQKGQDEDRSYAQPAGYDDFNEEYYLASNPDVAAAVDLGLMGSGWQHWETYGQYEAGRSYGNPYAEARGDGFFTLTDTAVSITPTEELVWEGVSADSLIDFLMDLVDFEQVGLAPEAIVDVGGITINGVEPGEGEEDAANVVIDFVTTTGDIVTADAVIAAEYMDFIQSLVFDQNGASRLSTRIVDEEEPADIILTTEENNGGTFESGLTDGGTDVIFAGRPELLHGAYIDAGRGYDFLEVDMKGVFAQPLQLLNIEQINVQNLPNIYGSESFNDEETSSALDLSRATSLQKLVITEGGSDLGIGENELGDLTILGIRNNATARLEGNFTQNVTLHYSSGQGDALKLEMANVTATGDHVTLKVAHNVGAVELHSEGRSNIIEQVDFGTYFQQLTVTGDALLAIEDDLTFAWGEAYIDASANTGGLRVNVNHLAGEGELDSVVIMGSQANDVIELAGLAEGAWININTNTGRDNLIIAEDLSAGEGSVLTGSNLTVTVEADADLRKVEGNIRAFNIGADGGLLLTLAQVQALGIDAFSAAHNTIPTLTIELSEDATLSDIIDLASMDSDLRLAFSIKQDATLTLTAEELHTYLTEDAVQGDGNVVIINAGLGFDENDAEIDTGNADFNGDILGDGFGTIDAEMLSGELHIIRAADGFERPTAGDDSDTLIIDTTGDAALTIDGVDAEQVETLIILGDQDAVFTDTVKLDPAGFTIDFSDLDGALTGLVVEDFNNVEEVIGNGAEGARIDVMLSGDVAEEGLATGLKSSGVDTYVVVAMDDGVEDESEELDFHMCDNTQGVKTIGLQGNMGNTLTLTNVPWGAVNPTILFEGDGYANWDELPKAAGNPDESNVGTIRVEYFFDGAPANVLITNQGVAPGLTSTGTARPIAIDGIETANAASLNITVEDGNAVIYSVNDDADDVTLISANDITLHLDGDDFDSIDASAVAGDMTLHIEDDTDFSETELTDIDAVVLEDGVTVTMTLEQITAIGTENITVEDEDAEATLNIGNYDGSAFDFSSLALDGIVVNTVTFAADSTIAVNADTDFTGVKALIIPSDTTVTMSAEQYKQLVESGATITTEVDGEETGALIVDLNGDLLIGDYETEAGVDVSDRATINGSNVTFDMADGETLNVNDFFLADGLQVDGDAEAATKPLVNFTFEDSGVVPFADTIDVDDYDGVDLRIFDSLLDRFYIDANDSGEFEGGENSQSIEDLLENLDSANILNIYQEEVVVELDPRDREVVVESLASPDGIEFSAEGELADYVRSIDLTLEADADNAAAVEGDIIVNDGQAEAGYTMLTINAADTDGAAVGPVTITGDIYSEGDDGAGEDGDLLSVTINAAVDLVIGNGMGDGTLTFSSTEAEAEATLKLTGAGDVTLKAIEAGVNVDTLNIVTTGYTGALTVTAGSDAIEMGAATALVFTGDADIVLDTDEDPGNNGIEGNALTSIDASEHTGALTLSVIESVSATDFTFTTGTGATTATLSAILDADPTAEDPAEPGWSLNVGANTTLTLTGSTFTSGALAIAGAGTVVFEGNVDLTALVDEDGNSLLDFSADTVIELAPDTTLSLTAAQLDALNEAGVTFTKQAFDEDTETEAVITVTGITGDLTAANEDLDADLDLSQADNLVLSDDAILTGEQVSGKTVEGNGHDLDLTGITADTDLSGIAGVGTLTAAAGETDTSLTLAAAAIDGITMTVTGAALGVVTVTGVEDVVGAEGDADEGDVNVDFSNLTVELFDDEDAETDEEVIFQLDSTGDVHLNGADFGLTLDGGVGATVLAISGTGSVTAEAGELATADNIELDEDATLSVTTAQHTAVGADVAGEGTLEVNDLGGSIVTIETGVAGETVNYKLTFTEDAGDGLVTINDFTANTADAQDILDFSAALPEAADHSLTKYTAELAANQLAANDILVVSSAVGNAVDAAAIETAFAEAGAFMEVTVGDDTAIFTNGTTKIIFVYDGANTDAWLWEDSLNGQVEQEELTQVATLVGVDTADLVAGNFNIA